MKISFVGAGYVGLVYAYLFANLTEHDIFVLDNNEEKISLLKEGKAVIKNEPFPKAKNSICFTTNYEEGLKDSDFIFICVDTPCLEDGSIDLSHVNSLIEPINKYAKETTFVVIKSTVIPGFCRSFATKINNGLVISNPEFLKAGSAYKDAKNPDRIIIGENKMFEADPLVDLYVSFYNPDLIHVMKSESAELSKYAANSFLATKVSFINEISNIANLTNADIDEVITGLSLDPRIGKNYLNPGLGFGGGCIPKDLSALVALANEKGYEPLLLESVAEVNINQPSQVLKIIQSKGYQINEKNILVVGCAFKAGSSSIFESPSIKLIKELEKHHAEVLCYDPNVDFSKTNLTVCNDLLLGISKCDLVIVVNSSLINLEDKNYTIKPIVII